MKKKETKPLSATDKRKPKVVIKQKINHFSPPLKYKIAADDEIKFTKAKASQFLELKTFEGEREVRERHVQFLFDEYTAGRFLWQNVLLASARLPNGDEYRINGQHTCWMRVFIPDRDEPVDAVVRAMTYTVADEHQLRSLYSAFDRGAPRTVAHVGKVLLMGTRVVDGIPLSIINSVLAGFKIYFSSDVHKRGAITVEEWCGMIEANHATNFNIVGRFVAMHEKDARWVRRSAVVAAMLATFEKSVEGSTEFWDGVCNGLGMSSKTDPRYLLRKYLSEHVLGASIASTQSVHYEEMYKVCIQMWNHYRDKTTVQFVKPPTERPKVKA